MRKILRKKEIPMHTQKILLTELCETIFGCVARPKFNVKWNSDYIYQDLTPEDKDLARLWVEQGGSSYSKNLQFEMSQMTSARAAEKTAALFYQMLDYSVQDVSIRQLWNNSDDWKIFDLLVEDSNRQQKRLIDVKNSRTPFNHKSRYVEHCVSRYKNHFRMDSEVQIAGVLSPYIKDLNYDIAHEETCESPTIPHCYELKDWRNGKQREDDYQRKKLSPIVFLGEVSKSIITQLVSQYECDFLEIVQKPSVVPVWMFDYLPEFYKEQEGYRNSLRDFHIPSDLSWIEARNHPVNPIPAFLGSNCPIPDHWEKWLDDWQIPFIHNLKPNIYQRVTLPEVYLYLLKHFLIMVKKNEERPFRPGWYWPMFYTHNKNTEKFENGLVLPLGIYDPVFVIADFIETLSILWKHREKLNLSQFVYYKFNGLGLLQARKSKTDQFTTVLAYCGGFISGKGKCGFSPLIAGEHENCPFCGKLVCPRCGFCSITCKEGIKRQAQMEKEIQIVNDEIPFREDFDTVKPKFDNEESPPIFPTECEDIPF